MKRLINAHKKTLLGHTKLDFEKIDRVTYLYEFDRAVQYARKIRAQCF